jgi:ATP-dependent 26S proteasome regulatory subunit
MSQPGPDVDGLREALRVSPENVPLRRLLGETLLARREYEAAEAEFRQALKYDPKDVRTLLALASAFQAQGKNELALFVLEEQVLKLENAPPQAYVAYARALLSSGRPRDAVQAYRQGITLDPEVEDAEIAERLGIGADWSPSEVVDGRLRAEAGGREEAEEADLVERPAIDFSKVGGMDDLKDEIRMKIILPMTNRDLYAAYGKAVGGGILLYGPPGCGKTYLARATAGEIRRPFVSVGLHDVLDMWIGQSEQRLHRIFEQARECAPCVLFFDEVDALGASRSDFRRSAGRQLINQFLSELDGMGASNEGILILAATNAPWHLDAAFRRPGRFDRILFVPPPDPPARSAILRIHLEGKPTENIQYEKIAKAMDGYSGADIRAVVELAVEAALREAMRGGRPIPLTSALLMKALAAVRPSAKEWFSTARNYAAYANEGGVYDDILKYLKMK